MRILQAVMLSIALLLLPVNPCLARPPASPQGVQLKSGRARPMHFAARSLEKLYGWRITYEDPPYAFSNVVPLQTEIPFLVPKGNSVLFSFAPPVDKTLGEKVRVIKEVLRQNSSRGDPGIFAAHYNGDFAHIVPVARVDQSGKLVPYTSLLSTAVTIEAKDRTVGEVVDAVLKQVSAIRGVAIMPGLMPINIYQNEHCTRGAQNESAEDVLATTFELVNNRGISLGGPPRRITWDLLYDPQGKRFFFSTHVISSNRRIDAQRVTREIQ